MKQLIAHIMCVMQFAAIDNHTKKEIKSFRRKTFNSVRRHGDSETIRRERERRGEAIKHCSRK